MSAPLLSPLWYRIASLTPRLRGHAQVHRHQYRNRRWYIVHDPLSGRNHRFNTAAHAVIGLMDGQRTVHQIWEGAATALGDDAPTQDQTIALLAQLHGADLLKCDVPPDSDELLRRYGDHRRRQWQTRFGNPLALRFALFDPDAMLARAMPLVRPLFSPLGVVAWLLVVGYALLLAASNHEALVAQFMDRTLAPQNLLLLSFSYVVIKALHELGHAFAVKHWGGHVHEIGISLLVLMPLPYVDASAAAVFCDKRQRIVVGAAGIIVELFLAALAMFVWVAAEPGIVRTLAFDIVLIGSVSTLFFNGNPLLRFDGYYILSDAIGIPNLASRSNRYLGYLCRRYLFGVASAQTPAEQGERGWFVLYAIAAFGYRIFITFVIALFVAGKFFVVGVMLALWAVFALLVLPTLRSLRVLVSDPQIARNRVRAVTVSTVLLATTLALTVLLPFPLATRAEGVVWLPEQSRVRAGTSCQVRSVLAPVNTRVEMNAPLLNCVDPYLGARIELLEARLRELEARRTSLWSDNRVAAAIAADALESAAADLADARKRAGKLTLTAPVSGTFILPGFQDLPGRYVEQGELLGYVIDSDRLLARVVVSQSDAGMVRERTRDVELRLAHDSDRVLRASVARELPAASQQLPSPALGTSGGGRIAVDPADTSGLTALEKVFQFDVTLQADTPVTFAGGRVYARFDHGVEPLAWRWYRSLRRLFLRQFDV